MKRITFLLLSVFVYSNDSLEILDRFVTNYLLLAESKMQSSPMVWQDVKEGYLRNYTLRYVNTILDSLNDKISIEKIKSKLDECFEKAKKDFL